jgi:hypothetical protein
MSTRAEYALEEGRRPSFTSPEAIMAEERGWYRNKGHRRRPGVVRGRQPRLSNGKASPCISYNMHTQPEMRPFNDYLQAYLHDHITQGELDHMANLYGRLGYKVRGKH